VSSLWTPGGEHRVPRAPAEPAPGGPEGAAAGAASTPAGSVGPVPGGDGGRTPPDQRGEGDPRLEEEMRQLTEQLLATPAADVIVNHCYGIFELAALHLGSRPPHLDEARLAIDALAAIVEGLGERLGEAAPTMREGLASIRLAFVELAAASGSAGREGGPPR
jgi:hypothetical protein